MTLFKSERQMRTNLTRLALLSVFCLLFAAVGMAAPACGTTAGSTPQNAALAVPGLNAPPYVTTTGGANGYVCDIGNLEFSNFTYSSSSVSPSSVNANPETTPGNQGLQF